MAYIISELWGQYGGKLEVAEQMMLQSKFGGADAVKIQLYSGDFDKNSLDHDQPGDYLSISYDDMIRLKKYAEMLHIDFFASYFDEERFQWCVDAGIEKFKIANWASKNAPELVEKSIATGKEVIISLDHEQAQKGKPYDAPNVKYLYTESIYPAKLEQMHIPDFQNSWFDGYSDHTPGITAVTFALARGATIIEKHFTLSPSWQKTKEGAHLCGMTVDDLRQLQILGRGYDILLHKKLYQYDSQT